MSRRFPKVMPSNELELERFYLAVIDKLQGTTASLDDLDQRAQSPVGAMQSELERTLSDIIKAIISPLNAQISELERQIRNTQRDSQSAKIDDMERRLSNALSQSTKVDDLERRINSIEASARF